MKEKKRKE